MPANKRRLPQRLLQVSIRINCHAFSRRRLVAHKFVVQMRAAGIDIIDLAAGRDSDDGRQPETIPRDYHKLLNSED